MSEIFSDQWFRGCQAFLEKDEDFRRHARWFTGTIAFRRDQAATRMRFERGLVTDVAPGVGEPDFLITGTSDGWSHLFDRRWALVRLYRSQKLLIRGDAVQMMKNWKAIFFIVEGLKAFELSR